MPESEKTRLLVVDDDAAVLAAYESTLVRHGFVVSTALTGAGAVERMKTGSFDVIVSDIAMPEMTGIEFLKVVRARDLDVPVILATGNPHLESAIHAVEYGAFRYLAKPVHPATFLEAVRKAAIAHRFAKLKREALEAVGAEGRDLGDRAALEGRFETALATLRIAFQPIGRWSDKSVFGYEAMVRSEEPSLTMPPDLADAAERLGRSHDLGRAIRRSVADSAEGAPPGAILSLNLHPRDLNDFELYSESAPMTTVAGRVVLELTERTSLNGVPGLASRVARLRALGFRFAVDDLGAGHAGLADFLQVEPEFVKLDRALVRGLDASSRKRSVVKSLVALCTRDLGLEVVADGVNTSSERDALTSLGCELLQGDLFAEPQRGFPALRW